MSRTQLYGLTGFAALFIAVLWAQGPIPQDTAYHAFADARPLFGIPNFWNVASNLPIFMAGVAGFPLVFRHFLRRPDAPTRWLPVLLCVGMAGAGIGSAYYHAWPDSRTLVWDRLPMTLMFMPLLGLFLYRFADRRFGWVGLLVLAPLGVGSVLYWHWTDDLRPYVFVQFFPMLCIPLLLLLKKEKPVYARYIWLVLGWYVAAKIFEKLDSETYAVLGFWSGHTLKHLISGLALYYVLRYYSAWEQELLA
jgi:hypothetical protein